MSREFWEIVRADELKVGDVVRQSVNQSICEIEWMSRGRSSVLLNDCRGHLAKEFVFRRIPDADDPRVLRRALRLAIFALYDEKLYVPTAADPQNYINQARRELESECER